VGLLALSSSIFPTRAKISDLQLPPHLAEDGKDRTGFSSSKTLNPKIQDKMSKFRNGRMEVGRNRSVVA